VQPGVTTDEIDRAVHKMIIDSGAYPSPLRYGVCRRSPCPPQAAAYTCTMPDASVHAHNVRSWHVAISLFRTKLTHVDVSKFLRQYVVAERSMGRHPIGHAGGFPKSVCTSINEVMCHGIPDSRPLQDGDIVNIDVTVFLNVRSLGPKTCALCTVCQ